MKNKKQTQVLLIHIREDEMREHEFERIYKTLELTQSQFSRVNVFEELPNEKMLEGKDLLLIGGAGDYLVSENKIPKIINSIKSLAISAREAGMPILGICFGAHIIAEAFGGSVEKDEDNQELGTFGISLLPQSENCPVFKDMPSSFTAQLGHKDHIICLPSDAVLLASSEKSECQAFTFEGEPVYALTFHPELDMKALNYRLDYYANQYNLSEAILREIKSRVKESPKSSEVLKNFFDKVVLEGASYMH